MRYIVDQGSITPSADGNWSFAPTGRTTVLCETGSKARDCVADLKGLEVEDAGNTDAGFARFRIKL